MRLLIPLTVIATMLTGILLLVPPSRAQQPAPATQPSTQSGGQVHSITLPNIESTLPSGPNQQVCQINCSICHSTRYITMQPNFSRETWTAEVQKMIKNYGAPIGQPQAEQIVEYLYSIRGSESLKND